MFKFSEYGLEAYDNNSEIEKVIVAEFEIFYNEETGYGVYNASDENEHFINIKGVFPTPLIIGQTYKTFGKVTSFKGEKQLEVESIVSHKPVNKTGIIRYLMTLKGLKSRAEEIYKYFGERSIDVLLENPTEISDVVPGVGVKSVIKWQEELLEMRASQSVIMSLLEMGLSAVQSKELYLKYKDTVLAMIEENPYVLGKIVNSYGFDKCDKVAKAIGYDLTSPNRIEYGVFHALRNSSSSGHCYLTKEQLVAQSIDILQIRLTLKEMGQLLTENKSVVEYSLGDRQYSINKTELQLAYNNTLKASKYAQRKSTYVLIDFTEEEIINSINQLISKGSIISDHGNRLYRADIYEAETKVAEIIYDIVTAGRAPISNVERAYNQLILETGYELEDMQKKAILEICSQTGGFFILNGSAGSGKTFTLNLIVKMLNKISNRKPEIMLLAPTGKASKVASKATGMRCTTVHRGLEYCPEKKGFLYDSDNRLSADVIVVDESSMLDILLTYSLLQAVKNGAKVIFLGDTKQLPSVGPGNVLKDLIQSELVTTITLNVIKRQTSESGIIANANRIIKSEMITSSTETEDAYVIKRDAPKAIINGIVESVKRIQEVKGYGLDEIQVLCPQRVGVVGAETLNYTLQSVFNPKKDGQIEVLNKNITTIGENMQITVKKLFFREGDKVIHTKNNNSMVWYELNEFGDYQETDDTGVSNGETGIIAEVLEQIDIEGDKVKKIVVNYDGKYLIYTKFEELDHAFAMTIHKAQGSQWGAVIVPITLQNRFMLENNLIYTAWTRAESFGVIVGQNSAIDHAVKTFKSLDRNTALGIRLEAYKNLLAS